MTSILLKKAFLLFLITACMAPLGDYGHVSTGTTSYHWNQGPHLLLSPWWFVVVVALFASFLGEMSYRLKKYLRSNHMDSKPKSLWASIGSVMTIYAATSLLPKEHPAVEAILISSLAIWVWSIIDGTTLGLMMGLFAILGASGGEIILVSLGAFSYHPKINWLVGVAPWLPALHFSFGVSIVTIEEILDQTLKKKNLNERCDSNLDSYTQTTSESIEHKR